MRMDKEDTRRADAPNITGFFQIFVLTFSTGHIEKLANVNHHDVSSSYKTAQVGTYVNIL